MSNHQQQQSSVIMDYLTAAGYEVQYRIDTLRKPLSAEREFTVSVLLGDELYAGTSGVSFSVSEERLLVGLLRAIKWKADNEKTQRLEQASLAESQQKSLETTGTSSGN